MKYFSKNCPGFCFFFATLITWLSQPEGDGTALNRSPYVRTTFFSMWHKWKNHFRSDCHFGPFWKDLPSTVWPCHVAFHVLLCLTKDYLVDTWKLIPPDYMLTWWDPSRISPTSSAAWWSLVQSGFSLGLRWLPTWFWSTWIFFDFCYGFYHGKHHHLGEYVLELLWTKYKKLCYFRCTWYCFKKGRQHFLLLKVHHIFPLQKTPIQNFPLPISQPHNTFFGGEMLMLDVPRS